MSPVPTNIPLLLLRHLDDELLHLVDLVDLHFYFLGVLQPVSLGILHQHNGILHLSNYWLIKHDYLFFFDKIDKYEVNKKNKKFDD